MHIDRKGIRTSLIEYVLFALVMTGIRISTSMQCFIGPGYDTTRLFTHKTMCFIGLRDDNSCKQTVPIYLIQFSIGPGNKNSCKQTVVPIYSNTVCFIGPGYDKTV